MERGLPTVPPSARRWVSEMEEIRDTFAGLGMTPHIFDGVAEMYRLIGSTPLGEEFPESRDRERTFTETVKQLAEYVRFAPGGIGPRAPGPPSWAGTMCLWAPTLTNTRPVKGRMPSLTSSAPVCLVWEDLQIPPLELEENRCCMRSIAAATLPAENMTSSGSRSFS